MIVQFSNVIRKKILVVDACIYTQNAIRNILLDTTDYIGVVCNNGYSFNLDGNNMPEGIVIGLRSTLKVQISILKKVVELCNPENYNGTIVLISDMSPRCAWALLKIAGLSENSGKNIFLLPSRTTPIKMKKKISMIFENTNETPPIIKYKDTVSLCQLKNIKSMIDGVSEYVEAKKLNLNVKSIYNTRRRILHNLDIPSKHSFHCGSFVAKL